ncbi:MAG: metallophosphoesterase [Armatimonadota bacterium]|nr:metallophosphoesterase [Armatimonadota bacterium]
MRKLNALILGILLTFSSSVWGSPATLRFAVLGDTRHQAGDNSSPVETPSRRFLENIREINLLAPDLVIDVGDLVLGYTDKETLNREWDAYDRAVRGFETKYYQVIGNHDVWDAMSQDVYRERYGPLYYSFDQGGAHFVVLDSEVVGSTARISGEQLGWLKRDLEAGGAARGVFVFLHKPLWWDSEKSRGEWSSDPWMRDVHPLLVKYGVDAVFAGHFHRYESEVRDGVQYIVTGGGGAEVAGPAEFGNLHHFVMVAVKPDGNRIAVIRTGGVAGVDIVTPISPPELDSLKSLLSVNIDTVEAHWDRPLDSKTAVRIYNRTGAALELRLDWELPLGWSVEPATSRLDLEPSRSAVVEVRVRGPRMTTPTVNVPRLSIRYRRLQPSWRVYQAEKRTALPMVWR